MENDNWRLVSAKFTLEGTAYHPLVCHMLDVAAVARSVWTDGLGEGTRRLLTEGLGLESGDAAQRWIAFLAGAHDVGKAAPLFQSLDPGAAKRLDGLTIPERNLHKQKPGHGEVTAAFLPAFLMGRGLDRRLAQRLAEINNQ